MLNKKTPLLLVLAASAVSACTVPNNETMSPDIDQVETKIAESVEKAAAANAAVAEVEVATAKPVRAAPAATVPENVVLPAEAIQPITADWNGPIEGFLKDVSERADYKFKVTGRAPANQMMVTIQADDEPLYGVVRRAGNMVHSYADVALNPTSKTITLRYGG